MGTKGCAELMEPFEELIKAIEGNDVEAATEVLQQHLSLVKETALFNMRLWIDV